MENFLEVGKRKTGKVFIKLKTFSKIFPEIFIYPHRNGDTQSQAQARPNAHARTHIL